MGQINSWRSVRFVMLASTALLTLVLPSGAALAQDGPPQEAVPQAPATTPSSSDQSSGFEDIVVTARKTEEAAQRVPVTLTALSQQDLQTHAVLNVQDLQTSTPGLFVGTNIQGGDANFAIRGARSDNGTSPVVAVYIDDVPVVQNASVANMVYDMQSITTLKGPQGTLFGANSTGGAIIFRPNKPTDRFEGYLMAGYGNYDRKEVQAVVNLPISDMLQVRVAGEIVRRDGYVDNLSPYARPENRRMNDDRHESARISVRFKPTDTLTNDTVFDYFHMDNASDAYFTANYQSRFDYTTFLGITLPVDYAKAGIQILKPFQTQSSGKPFFARGEFFGVANTTDWQINPDWSAKLVIGYRNDRLDNSQNQIAARQYSISDGRTLFENEQWTVEPSTTASWGDGRWSNKIGLFYDHLEMNRSVSYTVLDLPFDFTGIDPATVALVKSFYPLQANQRQSRLFETIAAYDQLSVKLNDELTFTAGGRLTHDKGRFVNQQRTAFGFTTPSGIGPYGDFDYGPCAAIVASYANYNPATCSGTAAFKKSSAIFSLSVEDQLERDKMLYASLKSGYLIGGFNDSSPVVSGQTFGPEKVTEVEGGLKADWTVVDRPLRTNISFFYGNYSGQQRVAYGIQANGTTFFKIQNAGSTRFYGLDSDVSFKPANFLTLNAAYQFIVSEYTNFNAALNIPISAAVDLAGQQTSQTPKHIVTASATLSLPVPESVGKISATLSFFYRSTTKSQDAPTIGGHCANGSNVCTAPGSFIPDPTLDFTRFDQLPAYSIFNFTAQWGKIAGTDLSAEFFVKNLTNRIYYTAGNNQAGNYGASSEILGDPRTYGVRLRYTF